MHSLLSTSFILDLQIAQVRLNKTISINGKGNNRKDQNQIIYY